MGLGFGNHCNGLRRSHEVLVLLRFAGVLFVCCI